VGSSRGRRCSARAGGSQDSAWVLHWLHRPSSSCQRVGQYRIYVDFIQCMSGWRGPTLVAKRLTRSAARSSAPQVAGVSGSSENSSVLARRASTFISGAPLGRSGRGSAMTAGVSSRAVAGRSAARVRRKAAIAHRPRSTRFNLSGDACARGSAHAFYVSNAELVWLDARELPAPRPRPTFRVIAGAENRQV